MSSNARPEIERVDVEGAKKLLSEGWIYVDVRSVPEYAAGHPAGAHNVPYLHAAAGGMQPNPDFMRVMQAVYPKDARLVIGCQSGNRSMRAARELLDAGFRSIVELRPGYGGRRNAFGQVEEAGWAASEATETTTPGGAYDELWRGS
jgi:rhodanese-related sulfurtransferase